MYFTFQLFSGVLLKRFRTLAFVMLLKFMIILMMLVNLSKNWLFELGFIMRNEIKRSCEKVTKKYSSFFGQSRKYWLVYL